MLALEKTKVLTSRLAHEISLGAVRPRNVLAVTFTNKAAREMQERVIHMVGEDQGSFPWLGTFHSIGSKILRQHAELAGRNTRFTILDANDQNSYCP